MYSFNNRQSSVHKNSKIEITVLFASILLMQITKLIMTTAFLELHFWSSLILDDITAPVRWLQGCSFTYTTIGTQ